MTESTQDQPAEDLRSDLQKQEEAEHAAFQALPRAEQVMTRLRDLIDQMNHQIKHNAPASPGMVQELQAIHDFIKAGHPS